MQEVKLDMIASKEAQLKVLVPYLEEAAKHKKGEEPELPLIPGTRILIGRYLAYWTENLYTKKGLTAKGALLYYRKLVKEK